LSLAMEIPRKTNVPAHIASVKISMHILLSKLSYFPGAGAFTVIQTL